MGIVEVPMFPNVELRWWMEDYFVRKQLTDFEKLHMAGGFIEGEAAEYLDSISNFFPIRSWDEMKTKFIWEFGIDDDPEKIIMKAKFDRFHKAFMNGDPRERRGSGSSVVSEVGNNVRSSLLTESLSLRSQVLDPNLEQNRNDSLLGYRDGALNIDNHGSMIHNCELAVFEKLPEFKGPNPNVWLSKAEKFFNTY
uniref:Retrotransposon gag domain-containing protein n=1 Tax=Brassica oleracea var. oleracea TaxID=109376 RepID=A0A0D3A9E4_BRAOL